LFTRTRYQNGSLRVKSRENGLRVWAFRYYEPVPDGAGRGSRAVTVGTLQEYPSEAAARKSPAVQAIVLRINAEYPLGPVTASTVRYSTRVSYQSFIDRYIRPPWAETPITGVKPMAVEDWLRRLKLASKTRGHVKTLMSVMFKCAQRWELIPNNPMQLVWVKDVSKRQQRPSVLTAGEFHKLLPHLREPYRTMVLIAGCLGLRAGEIVGLQWGDFNLEKSTLLVQRGIVHGRVGDVKTEYSRDAVPIAPELTRKLQAGHFIRTRFKRSTSEERLKLPRSQPGSARRPSATAFGRGWTRPKHQSEYSAN
jgi:integrase